MHLLDGCQNRKRAKSLNGASNDLMDMCKDELAAAAAAAAAATAAAATAAAALLPLHSARHSII
jgi:hypothetical protein